MRKDPTYEIREHYIRLLSGMVVKSKSVPVYNLAQVAHKPPYVMVFGGTAESQDTKSGYSGSITVNIQVHTIYEGDYGGEKFADEVVHEIIRRRYDNTGYYGSTENFDIITCIYTVEEAVRIQSATAVHILKSIQFNHFITQKKQ